MKTALENYIFWSEEVEEGHYLKNRAAHHHQEFAGVPPRGHLQRNFRLVDTRHAKKTDFYLKVGDSAGD